MADQDAGKMDMVVQFMSVTSADVSTANFYLESAAWDMGAAVASFFDHGAGAGAATGAGVSAPAATPAPSMAAPASRSAGARAGGTSSSRFATLADVTARDEDEDDEDDEPQGYYAGGEKSGQMIQDPRDIDRRRNEKQRREQAAAAGSTDISESIMERARQMAAQMDSELQKARDEEKFVGAGYRLGEEAGNSEPITKPSTYGKKLVTKRLVFYQNGFLIEGDNAVLRAYDDPANAGFLRDIERGFVPREMESDEVAQVDIELENRRNEEYVPPKPQIVPFSGSGMRLGDSSMSSAAPSASVAPAVLSSTASAPLVDENLPVYSIQVRLADGRRLVARLNDSHTVADLRTFVNASDPSSSTRAYDLALTFPKKVLSETGRTLKDEGLKGAVVVQTLR